MDNKTIGKFIAECRKEKNLTQSQLAEILGVTDKSISRWENGKTMPDLSIYEPLCQALDIKVSELLYGKRMTETERAETADQSAAGLILTKSQLETFGIFTEILIFVGIVIACTFPNVLADTNLEVAMTLAAGCFVWIFGLVLRVQIRQAVQKLEKI